MITERATFARPREDHRTGSATDCAAARRDLQIPRLFDLGDGPLSAGLVQSAGGGIM